MGIAMRAVNNRDFWSGIMFISVGVYFAWSATQYSLGAGGRMGPGFFPLAVGLATVFVGLFISLRALILRRADKRIGQIAWRPLIVISIALIVFAFSLPTLGVLVATVLLILISVLAKPGYSIWRKVIFSVIASLLTYVVFVRLLQMNLPAYPSIF